MRNGSKSIGKTYLLMMRKIKFFFVNIPINWKFIFNYFWMSNDSISEFFQFLGKGNNFLRKILDIFVSK